MRLAFFTMIFSFLAVLQAAAQESVVEAAHIAANGTTTTVVFDLSTPVEPLNIFTLAADSGRPYRVVIDLPEVGWAVAGGTTLTGSGLIHQVRYGRNRPGQSRIVLDLVAPASITAQEIVRASQDAPARLALSLSVASEATFNEASGFPELPSENDPSDGGTFQSIEQVLASLTGGDPNQSSETDAPRTRTRPVIVIDPGHGGRDPGMVAVNDRREKEIVLDMGRVIRDTLNETGLFDVYLTRDEDVFLQLNERYAVAQELEADLFISIHVDSNDDHSARGATIYTLSERASDAEAARVAARENQSDAVAGFEVDEELTRILIDLAQRETMNLSAELAVMLVDGFSTQGVHTVGRPHRFAGFRVLTAPDVPSILLETGFGTNRQDAALLISEDYQVSLGRSLAQALIVYFDLGAEGEAWLAQNEAAGN